jgi:hypothetical protein
MAPLITENEIDQPRCWSYPSSDALITSLDSPATDSPDEHGGEKQESWCDINDNECVSYANYDGSYIDYDGPITTMMIRNIPCRCSTEKILEDINSLGYEGEYDFFYLPQTRKRSSNLGYGFINFKTAEAAADFQLRMSGHKFAMNSRHSKSHKICYISPATIQGLENTKKHFIRSTVLKTSRAPCFFTEDGSMGKYGETSEEGYTCVSLASKFNNESQGFINCDRTYDGFIDSCLNADAAPFNPFQKRV